MKKTLAILCLLLPLLSQADRVKVRLFSNNTVEFINISFDLGYYNIYANDTLLL